MTGRMLSGLTVAMLAAGACSTKPAEAPASAVTPASPAADFAPVVSLNEIMVYVVDSHSNELWDAAMTPPTSDAGWKELQRAAIAIAAAGSLTRVSGNGPKDQQWTQQADWVKYSQAMSDAGLAAVTAVRSRTATELAKAGDRLVVTCIDCHREYKLDVPKLWTERQFPPEEAKRP
jgi:hypothetical protein